MFFDRQYRCVYDMFSQEHRGRSAGVRLADKDADIEYPFANQHWCAATAAAAAPPFAICACALCCVCMSVLTRFSSRLAQRDRRTALPSRLVRKTASAHTCTLFCVCIRRLAHTHTASQVNAMIYNNDNTTNQHKLCALVIVADNWNRDGQCMLAPLADTARHREMCGGHCVV